MENYQSLYGNRLLDDGTGMNKVNENQRVSHPAGSSTVGFGAPKAAKSNRGGIQNKNHSSENGKI